MTIEQQAKELIDKFYYTQIKILNKEGITQIDEIEFEIAKQCAIICCDEIIKEVYDFNYSRIKLRDERINNYEQVKNYIENNL